MRHRALLMVGHVALPEAHFVMASHGIDFAVLAWCPRQHVLVYADMCCALPPQVATQDQFAVWVLRRRAPRLRTPWPQHWAAFACGRMYLWGQMLRRPTKSNAHLRKSALRELRVARFGVHKLAGLAPLQAKQSTCAFLLGPRINDTWSQRSISSLQGAANVCVVQQLCENEA